MKVLLVEDSRTVGAYIEGILGSDPEFLVLPTATDGLMAVRTAEQNHPDIILMDLVLPVLDGISAIQQIMSKAPCPIIVLSGHLYDRGIDRTFDAFGAGAVDVLVKPSNLGEAGIAGFRERLLKTLRLMAQACIVRRPQQLTKSWMGPGARPGQQIELVVVGGSTGSPKVLFELLQQMPAPYPVPIVIGQHTLQGFEHGLASWLSSTGHRVRVVTGELEVEPEQVYLAPSDRHLLVTRAGFKLLPNSNHFYVPCIDMLFSSAADSFGNRAMGILLSGMGEDGARGLLDLYQHGALTVTQQSSSCVVDGMPATARRMNASVLDFSPREIALFLTTMANERQKQSTKGQSHG